jgi:hypothetical protein
VPSATKNNLGDRAGESRRGMRGQIIVGRRIYGARAVGRLGLRGLGCVDRLLVHAATSLAGEATLTVSDPSEQFGSCLWAEVGLTARA